MHYKIKRTLLVQFPVPSARFIYLFFYSSSCCMWTQRSLVAPTMFCHYAPRSPPPRKSTWTEPSCQMEPSSPLSPLFSLDSNWNAVQVDLQSNVSHCARLGVQQEIKECRDNKKKLNAQQCYSPRCQLVPGKLQ